MAFRRGPFGLTLPNTIGVFPANWPCSRRSAGGPPTSEPSQPSRRSPQVVDSSADKARLSLLQEFEDKIYEPKEKEKATGLGKPPLLKKGKETFQLVERYLKHYNTVRCGNNYDQTGRSFQFDNLFKVMLTGLPSTDWIPPLLLYFDKFGHDHLLQFLTRLDNKFSADWIAEYSPTERIEI